MPAFPHLNDVDMENLVSYVSAPVPGGGRGRGAGRYRRSRLDLSSPREVLSRAPRPDGAAADRAPTRKVSNRRRNT